MNIEDQFWLDVMSVVETIHDQDKAIGNALRFLRFAQEKHKQGKLVSEDDFRARGFVEALIGIFAERVAGGIQAAGAKKYFAWLDQKVEAGSKGGRSKSEAKTKHLKQNRSETKRTVAKHSDTEPSISISPSISSSNSNSSLVAVDPASGDPAVNDPALNRAIWKAYSDAYLVRYHKDPVRNAKVNGQVAQLGKRLGNEAPDIAAFYLTANKTFYVAKCHEFGLCLSDAEALHTQWFHGKAITNSDLKRFEKTVESNQLDQLINEGKI